MRIEIVASDEYAEVTVQIEVPQKNRVCEDVREVAVDRFAQGMDLPRDLITGSSEAEERGMHRRLMADMLRNGSRATLIALTGDDNG